MMDGVVVGIVRKKGKATLLLEELSMFDVHHGTGLFLHYRSYHCGHFGSLDRRLLLTALDIDLTQSELFVLHDLLSVDSGASTNVL